MIRKIEKIAVIGAGVMGAQIAAHFINARFSVDLYDMTPAGANLEKAASSSSFAHPQPHNQIVELGLERARKAKPPAFFLSAWSEQIKIGNLDDHFLRIGEAD